MLNALANTKFDTNDVLSMLKGHRLYVEKNTGRTIDGEVQKYLVNPEGIFSNNRHFIQKGGQMGMPNGDAPTESQSLAILGYVYSYLGTGEQHYLDDAEKYFDAYVKYFYAGQPIPSQYDPAHPWVSNWLINGKEKVLANFPLSDDGTITHGGFREKEFTYAPTGPNGQLQTRIPHNSTEYGQYLDRATFAYVGGLGWKSIVATVYGLKADGITIDWSDSGKARGKQFDVDWIVDHYGRRVSYDIGWLDDPENSDDFISKHPGTTKSGQLYNNDIGLITLKKTYYNNETKQNEVVPAGTYKTCYATKNPKSDGGFELLPNLPWHNRPLNVPAGWSGKYDATTGEPIYNDYQQLGNSSDSEQWFGDAAYVLWKITNKQKYYDAWQAVMANTFAYSDIDAHDKFFRVDASTDNPWTDGIAYDYHYPDDDADVAPEDKLYPDPIITRNKQTGYIDISVAPGVSQHTMEQQAVWYRVKGNALISTEAGGQTANNTNVGLNVELHVNKQKTESTDISDIYSYQLEPSSGSAYPRDIPLRKFYRSKNDSGRPYTVVGGHVTAWSNNAEVNRCKITPSWSQGLEPGGSTDPNYSRDGGYMNIKWPDQMDPDYVTGCSLGLTWHWKEKNPDKSNIKIAIESIVYRSTVPFELSYYDTNQWGWTFTVPASTVKPGGNPLNIDDHQWTRHTFDIHTAKFNSSQKYHPHPAWFREIRSDRDLGASHHDHSWFIRDKDPAERQYFDGQRTTAPQYKLPNGDWHQMQNNDWQDPRWLDINNVYPIPWDPFHPAQEWRDSIDSTYYNMDRPDQFIIKNYWGNIIYSDHTPPSLPSSVPVDEQFDISFVGNPLTSPTASGNTQIYCVNELPPMYPENQERYLMMYSLTAEVNQDTPQAWSWEVGDCYVKNYQPNNLAYTPGVIPFSNIYSDAGLSTFDGWHGMPYPGYQYPFIYVEQKAGYEERMNNMINFMYDSQKAYAERYGILGPGMSAYIWNRWDNHKYVHPEHGDKIDGFTMYHWGTDNAWSGYQARAYFGAARTWYELKLQNREVPPKLIEYVENWAKYLFDFMSKTLVNPQYRRPISPTDWSMLSDGVLRPGAGVAEPLPNDYTPHMCGLFLAGSCMAALAGSKYVQLEGLIEMLAQEIQWKDYSRKNNSHYWNTGVAGHVMNGGIGIPWEFDDSDKHDETNNSKSYGFHTGEVMRGLGMYLVYKRMRGGNSINMYDLHKQGGTT